MVFSCPSLVGVAIFLEYAFFLFPGIYHRKDFFGVFWDAWGLPFSFPVELLLEMSGPFPLNFLALY